MADLFLEKASLRRSKAAVDLTRKPEKKMSIDSQLTQLFEETIRSPRFFAGVQM